MSNNYIGDKVVIRNSPHYDIFEFQRIQDERAYLKDSTCRTFSIGSKNVELARPSEIAAGHRIDRVKA